MREWMCRISSHTSLKFNRIRRDQLNAYRSLLAMCLSLVLWGCNQQSEPAPVATPATVTENTSAEPQANPLASKPVVKNSDSTPVENLKPGQPPPVAPSELTDVASGGTPAELPKPDPEITKILTKVYEEANIFEVSKNDFRNIAVAFHNYHDTFTHFPAAGGSGEAEKTGLSWRVHLLPFLDQVELYNQFHLDEAWDSEHNKTLISKMPANYGSNPDGKTRVHVFAGENTPFSGEKGPRLVDVIDGTTNTILCVLAGDDKADIWTKPGGLSLNVENPKAALGKVKETFLVAMIDGSVREVKTDIPFLARLIQHNDGQIIPGEFRELRPASSHSEPVAELPELPPAQPMPTQFDAKFIPDNALLAGVAYPRHLLEHPLVIETAEQANWTKQSAREFLWNEMLKGVRQAAEEAGFRADAIDELRLVITPLEAVENIEMPDPVNGPTVHFAVYMHSAVPLDVESMSRFLFSHSTLTLKEVDGHVCLVDENQRWAYMFLSGTEFILADHPDTIQSLLKANSSSASPATIANQLHANGSRMVQFAGDIPQELVSGLSPNMIKQFPPAMIIMFYIREARNLLLAFDLDHQELLAVDVKMSNSNNATKLGTLASSQLDAGRQMFEVQKAAIEQNNSKELVEILSETLTDASVNTDDDMVKIRLSRPEHLSNLPVALKPALDKTHAVSLQVQRKNNLRQLGLAFHYFHKAHSGLPALDGLPDTTNENRGLSWRVYLLPYIGHLELHKAFHLDESWDSEHNKKLISEMPKIFGDNPDGKTQVHLLTGEGAPFKFGEGLNFRDITDGASNTILAIEASEETAEIWTKPGGLEFDSKEPLKCLGKLDPNHDGILVLYMDGLVRTLSKTINPEVFRRMVQYADGEPVDF
ncbi:MAG TPA: hypothetical protein DIW81_15060 [Planctomycetaceae bacterium]|nr:hypothetical protein [Planctomycetaceae bacterium]